MVSRYSLTKPIYKLFTPAGNDEFEAKQLPNDIREDDYYDIKWQLYSESGNPEADNTKTLMVKYVPLDEIWFENGSEINSEEIVYELTSSQLEDITSAITGWELDYVEIDYGKGGCSAIVNKVFAFDNYYEVEASVKHYNRNGDLNMEYDKKYYFDHRFRIMSINGVTMGKQIYGKREANNYE